MNHGIVSDESMYSVTDSDSTLEYLISSAAPARVTEYNGASDKHRQRTIESMRDFFIVK